MNNISVTQLKYLDAVVRAGGFSKAAEASNISQPALTRHIKALEDECQVPLLHRTSRGVFPTDEGRKLLEASTRVFDGLEYVRNVGASLAGKALRIRSVSTPRLAEFMSLCRSNLLNVEIELAIGTYADILDALAQHRCDIGFLTMPPDREDYDIVEVGRYRYHAYVGPTHEWASRRTISVHDLQDRGLIISPTIRRSRQIFDGYLQGYGITAPIVHEVGSIETIWHLAYHGMGIGILSDSGHTVTNDIVKLDFTEDLSIPLHMVSLKREDRTKLASAAFSVGSSLMS